MKGLNLAGKKGTSDVEPNSRGVIFVGILALGALAVILCSHGSANAVWKENGNPVCTATADQLSVEAVHDGAGGEIITWYNGGLFAQRVDASGEAVWHKDGVTVATAPGSQLPKLVSDGAGGAIITWSDFRTATSFDLFAQRIDGSGSILWPAEGVPVCTTACNEHCREIVSDGAGGAIITWSDDRREGDCDIYAQRLDASGKALWKTNGVAVCAAEKNQGFPQIVPDGNGGAIITWADFRKGTGFCIFSQRIDAAGKLLWNPEGVPVCTAPGNQLPRMTSDGKGGAIIAWRDPRRTADYDILAQRVTADGKVAWQEDGVPLCTVEGAKWWPLIASDGVGGAIVLWRDYRSGTNYDTYAQRIDASGKVLWKENGVAVCTDRYNERYHDMAEDGRGGVVVVWYGDRSGSYDIFAQRVDGSGKVAWKASGSALCSAVEDQQFPVVTSGGAGDALLVTWMDFRNGTNYDIYTQRVSLDGTIGPIEEATHNPDSAGCR